MTTVTEDGGRTNVYATEPTMYTEEPKNATQRIC